MMLKNKKISILFILIFITGIGLIYWYVPSKPKSFYSETTIKKLINATYEREVAEEIQDVIFIDKSHVFIPYISKEKMYGLSFWKWEHHKWNVVNIFDRGGSPYVWKIDPKDPSTYVIFWNYHPNDHVENLKFRLIQKRDFYSTEDISIYTPLVKLEQKINVSNKTYGYFKYPAEWIELLKLDRKLRVPETSLLFDNYSNNLAFYISWLPYLKNGKETFPENSVNGNSFSNGDEVFDHVMIETDHDVR
jgi:hypothetical protein